MCVDILALRDWRELVVQSQAGIRIGSEGDPQEEATLVGGPDSSVRESNAREKGVDEGAKRFVAPSRNGDDGRATSRWMDITPARAACKWSGLSRVDERSDVGWLSGSCLGGEGERGPVGREVRVRSSGRKGNRAD